MKQGQVELDAGKFIHDYKDSVLIHRVVVEDLNGKIKVRVKLPCIININFYVKVIVILPFSFFLFQSFSTFLLGVFIYGFILKNVLFYSI